MTETADLHALRTTNSSLAKLVLPSAEAVNLRERDSTKGLVWHPSGDGRLAVFECQKTKKGIPYHWCELPGGKPDPGETDLSLTFAREVAEEAGGVIDPENIKYLSLVESTVDKRRWLVFETILTNLDSSLIELTEKELAKKMTLVWVTPAEAITKFANSTPKPSKKISQARDLMILQTHALIAEADMAA